MRSMTLTDLLERESQNQSQFAARLGVHCSTLSRILTGRRSMAPTLADRIGLATHTLPAREGGVFVFLPLREKGAG